jgi:GNAT superfamily N-acetyltransferase
MQIRPVESKSDLRAFVNFPYQHYKDDPVWVPLLRFEQRNLFSPKHNPFLDHCTYQLFLLEDDGKLIGRVAAFVDHLAADYWGEQIGLFGYFECIKDPAAGRLLLETARDWLLDQGCTKMRGPWSFVSQEWGAVVEGFEPSPVIMGPYNPPYYIDYYNDFGLEKVQDMLCWYISGAEGYEIPERILKLTDAVAKRYKVRTRQMDLKNYDEEVQHIIRLSNDSIIGNWGYSPVTEAEGQAMARDLKLVVQERGVIFAENEAGEVIGFAIALPDLNTLLKGTNGRLFPLGAFKLLFGLPRLNRWRMFGLGVVPEYQGKAIDSLIYRALYETIYSEDMWMEINYVLDDNWPMINAIKKLNATPLRRYRVFEMEI